MCFGLQNSRISGKNAVSMRNYVFLMGLIGLTFGAGCGTAAANDIPSRTDVVARVHFAGTMQLAADAKATGPAAVFQHIAAQFTDARPDDARAPRRDPL